MALFKKKKKKKIVAPEEPEETPTIAAEKEEPKKELSPEAKRLISLIKIYRAEYYGVYRKEDFIELNPEVEMINMQFAIFAELRTLNGLLQKALENDE